MVDLKGNLVTDEDKIAVMALGNYMKVLENRPMKEEFTHIKDAKKRTSQN